GLSSVERKCWCFIQPRESGSAFVTAKDVKGNAKLPLGGGTLESKTRVQLNLTTSADSREYSPDIVGEITRKILKNGVSVSSQCERTLRVAWNCKIGMIEEIVGFHPQCNFHVFLQLEDLLECEI